MPSATFTVEPRVGTMVSVATVWHSAAPPHTRTRLGRVVREDLHEVARAHAGERKLNAPVFLQPVLRDRVRALCAQRRDTRGPPRRAKREYHLVRMAQRRRTSTERTERQMGAMPPRKERGWDGGPCRVRRPRAALV